MFLHVRLEKEGRGDTVISNCASIVECDAIYFDIGYFRGSTTVYLCVCVCVCVSLLGVADLDDAHLVGYESSV